MNGGLFCPALEVARVFERVAASRARYVTCPDCDGAGRLDDDGDPSDDRNDDPCETCHGRGEILEGAE